MIDSYAWSLIHLPLTPQAFILDYCNFLFSGNRDSLYWRLQSVQNAAAWLKTGTGRCDHITALLRELHWLPVRQRIKFRLAMLVYKSLRGLTAPYLTNDCQLVANSGHRRLRLADVDTCIVPRTNTRLGDRIFAVTGPWLWNYLPAELHQPDIEFVTFRRLLKTNLFKCDPD